MAQRVFILGAGASRFAGYPLGTEVWQFVRNKSGRFLPTEHQEVVAYIETVLAEVSPDEHDQPNLEHLFTLLDLADKGIGQVVPNKAWKPIRPKFIRMITEAFLHYQYGLLKEENNATLN